MNRHRLRSSLIWNLIIVCLVLIGMVMMLTGFDLMGENRALTATRLEAFKFFTVDSNVLAGICALILALFELRALKKDIPVPAFALILKLAATSAVTLTMLVTALFLGFLVDDFLSLYLNANFLFHLLIPVLCVLSFACVERTSRLRARTALFGVLPTVLYAIYYGINVFSHAEGQTVSPQYDWYYFVQGGLDQIRFVVPVMLGVSYLVSLILWAANHKKQGTNDEI